MMKIHKNDHYALMLICQQKCGRPRGGACGQGGRGGEMGKNLWNSFKGFFDFQFIKCGIAY